MFAFTAPAPSIHSVGYVIERHKYEPLVVNASHEGGRSVPEKRWEHARTSLIRALLACVSW